MTRFENVGVELQNSARTVEQANARYEKSCTTCCYHGVYICGGCDHCAIRQTHRLVIAAFEARKEAK